MTTTTRSSIRTFRDLHAWQMAKSLAVAIYHECQSLPSKELHTSYSQMRRSSESVPHNIAEGFGTGTRPGFLRYLRIARASLCEIESQREFSVDLGIMKPLPDTADQLARAQRVLQALITSLERSQRPGPSPSTNVRKKRG